MSNPKEEKQQPAAEVIAAIGAYLLFRQHEGGGPYGRIRYAAEQSAYAAEERGLSNCELSCEENELD